MSNIKVEQQAPSQAHKEEAAREQAELNNPASTFEEEIEALFNTFDSTLRALSDR